MIENFAQFAARDENFILVTADLGFSVFERFEEAFPKQFYNVGVCEQNMIGVAAGLAATGKKVFCYSIANFSTLRCLEQIRNDLCYHNLNVSLISMGGGFNYGPLGMTHHATEDISVMQSIPNLSIFTPFDRQSTVIALETALHIAGPSYIRLEKTTSDTSSVAPNDEQSTAIKKITDVNIISFGTLAKKIADEISVIEAGIGQRCGVLAISRIKPLSEDLLLKALKGSKYVIIVEENNVIGGLGAECIRKLCNRLMGAKFLALGIQDRFYSIVGNQDYLRNEAGISVEKLATAIKDFVIEK